MNNNDRDFLITEFEKSFVDGVTVENHIAFIDDNRSDLAELGQQSLEFPPLAPVMFPSGVR